eukprot:TRINITY_DN16875_c0_g1_i1.p1 TRINITY_DN16875_c0_g1~~TRINITY_DN16875_c0_g1_i1.p1  ORF type:complete len:64 (+),score=5.60 TRINITY_DN16875_c0_g1_i1:115-306(+)
MSVVKKHTPTPTAARVNIPSGSTSNRVGKLTKSKRKPLQTKTRRTQEEIKKGHRWWSRDSIFY